MTATLLRLVAAWLALATVAGTNAHAERSLLDDQRAIFRNAWASAERGDWVLSRNEQALLEPYVLWPVLRGRYLEAAMDKVPGSDIERFLNRHGTSRPARSLRFRYARYLARNGHNEAYLDIYAGYYRTLGNAELDCRAVGNFFANFERNSMPDPTSSGGFGAVSYLGAVVSTAEEKYEKVSFGDLDEQSAKFNDSKGWIAFVQHYFVSAWVPGSTEEEHSYQLRKKNQKYIMGYVDPSFSVSPNSTHSVGARLYLGPKILDTLQDVAPNLDLTIDFGILWIIAKPLFIVLDYIHSFIGNWGIAIILLTVLIKAIFFRLSAASYRSMANMRRVGPELQRIKELYGDDRQKLSQSMMELYKKEKINPLGGCLPMLVQMPVFIALYWVLLESVELRQAPFFFWIQDLSIKDPFFILPLAMGATMFLQMHLNPTPPDPMQARIMKLMPIVFTVFFLWFPAGLVLYWFVNNVLSIAQQWIITKNIEKQGLKTS